MNSHQNDFRLVPWIFIFALFCHGIPAFIIIYDATIGKISDYIRHKKVRKAVNFPDENYIKEHGIFLFYFVIFLKIYAPFGLFFSISNRRRLFVVCAATVLSDIVVHYGFSATGLLKIIYNLFF